jgi:hypothetical protein
MELAELLEKELSARYRIAMLASTLLILLLPCWLVENSPLGAVGSQSHRIISATEKAGLPAAHETTQ